MEPEQDIKKSKSAWRMLFVGFFFGVLVSFLVLVIIAFKYGPRGESNTVDLYSGHAISKLIPITKPFYKDWEQKLEKIKNDMQ